MEMYRRIADLPVEIEEYDLETHVRETSSGFVRTTTIVTLRGPGGIGKGEDVTYEQDHHDELTTVDDPFSIRGCYSIGSFSDHLDELELFPGAEPTNAVFRNYRRWALESAALDLGLHADETSLGEILNRPYHPVRFVVSTRLGDPPTTERIDRLRSIHPGLEFKLDPTSDWSADLFEQLADRGSVEILDLKGQYEGTEVDQPADPILYKQVVDTFPEAIIEDPSLTEETRPLFDDHEDRVSWDYPITGLDSVESLPWQPSWLNIKPSRFGSLRSLFETIEYCESNHIRMYGGGQFELGVGRDHLHTLASLFYPDTPNDVAPGGYHDPIPDEDVPASPLEPPRSPRGLAFD